jgi:hypothetical protein
MIEINLWNNISYTCERYIEIYSTYMEYSSYGVITAVIDKIHAKRLHDIFGVKFIEYDTEKRKWIELDGIPSGCGSFL